ncbi:hypothetical protein [Polaromonas sp.]|uniref:hypothetical protein n=1 Tax=Polaromonas sp. TaxID=1869339 RepID=UPI003750C1FE
MSETNLWERQWRDEMIAKARKERDASSKAYQGLQNRSTKYARSIAMVLAGREQVLTMWEAMPAQLPGETCFNCETPLPTGCGGRFKDDGDACLLNGSDRTSTGAIGQP